VTAQGIVPPSQNSNIDGRRRKAGSWSKRYRGLRVVVEDFGSSSWVREYRLWEGQSERVMGGGYALREGERDPRKDGEVIGRAAMPAVIVP
jgi:hypothetical protein